MIAIKACSRYIALVSFVLALCNRHFCFGQSNDTADVLNNIRASLQGYAHDLPNLVCDEQLDSAKFSGTRVKREVHANSALYVVRQTDTPSTGMFKEVRKILSVNGKPLKKSAGVKMPFIVTNGFGGTMQTSFGKEFASCNTYKIASDTFDGHDSIAVDVSVIPNNKQVDACKSISANRVSHFQFDARTLQILHFEEQSSDASEPSGFQNFSDVQDYAQLHFGKRTYSVPAKVRAAMSKWGSEEHLSYTAQFSNCHMFGSTVTIIPDQSNGLP